MLKHKILNNVPSNISIRRLTFWLKRSIYNQSNYISLGSNGFKNLFAFKLNV